MQMYTKKKIINFCLLLSFQFGYLEWGGGKHLFIFQAVIEIFQQAAKNILSILHPMILVPFAGEIALLYTLFQHKPNTILSYLGLASLSVFMLLLFFIGALGMHFKILSSTIPFILIGLMQIKIFRSQQITNN